MKLPAEIQNKIERLHLLYEKYKVKRAFLFGSAVNGDFNPERSDIDMLVDMDDLPPVERGEYLMKLWSELEDLFARKIDLLTQNSIRNPYLKSSIENSKYLIYDRKR